MTMGYEVRVEGELGKPLLRHLSWSHDLIPEQTLVRVDATAAELHALLQACSEGGLIIERVHRIGPARTSPAGQNEPPSSTGEDPAGY